MFCTDVEKFALQKLPAAESDTKGQREAIRSPEISSRWNNEVAKKRKYEDEREFDPKRRDESSFDRQHSNYHSQQDSYRRREQREETGFDRSDKGFRFSQGYNKKQEERGDKKVKQCTLMKKYIHMIQEGKKTVEGRINSGMFKAYRKGDIVRFFYQQDLQDDVTCEIEDAVPYESFEQMLNAEGVGRCIPGIHSVRDGVRAYHQIPGYEEKAKIHGVVAFRLKVLRCGSPGWRR